MKNRDTERMLDGISFVPQGIDAKTETTLDVELKPAELANNLQERLHPLVPGEYLTQGRKNG